MYADDSVVSVHSVSVSWNPAPIIWLRLLQLVVEPARYTGPQPTVTNFHYERHLFCHNIVQSEGSISGEGAACVNKVAESIRFLALPEF